MPAMIRWGSDLYCQGLIGGQHAVGKLPDSRPWRDCLDWYDWKELMSRCVADIVLSLLCCVATFYLTSSGAWNKVLTLTRKEKKLKLSFDKVPHLNVIELHEIQVARSLPAWRPCFDFFSLFYEREIKKKANNSNYQQQMRLFICPDKDIYHSVVYVNVCMVTILQ